MPVISVIVDFGMSLLSTVSNTSTARDRYDPVTIVYRCRYITVVENVYFLTGGCGIWELNWVLSVTVVTS